MNLKEAFITGLPFRRRGKAEWTNRKYDVYSFVPEDIMANDFEVKKEITIDAEAFFKAVKKTLNNKIFISYRGQQENYDVNHADLAKELGLL